MKIFLISALLLFVVDFLFVMFSPPVSEGWLMLPLGFLEISLIWSNVLFIMFSLARFLIWLESKNK
ncbi:hypothetical protein H5A34_12490 [Pectobacterium brasiliense]|uniref:hypothetical protein n=1 Tax=Pectobacterium brasiliense TaxID=180957 RepID=UPI001968B87B|nr:hypothetical protein [Pectobacterium brasiliense]MBN3069920.1 hypothetical protein [Pectobacterium brasiliense]MBN3246968.1 hypothetical protein [Pectobacterium brasiliense]